MRDRRSTVMLAAGAGLVLALGTTGGAVAGRLVTGKDIKDHSVTGDDIENGSVGGKQLGRLVNGSLGTLGGYRQVTKSVDVPVGSADYYDSTSIEVRCPKGTRVISGGYYVASINQAVVVPTSAPLGDGSGWRVFIHNSSASSVSATGYAICGHTLAPKKR